MGAGRRTQQGIIGRPRKNKPQNDEFVSEAADFIDSEATTFEKIRAALGDGGDEQHDWKVMVSQVLKTPEGQKVGWVFNADINELETLRERIAQECGPGRYRCRVMRDSVPFKQYDLEIFLTLAQRRAFQAPSPAAPTSQPAAAAGSLSPDLARVLENQNKTMEQMAALIASIANRPAGPSMSDMLAQMKMMQELLPKAPESDVGFKMFMQAFELAQKIQGEAGGGDGGGSSLIDLVRDVVKDLGPQLVQRLPPVNAAPAQPAQLALATPAQARPASQPVPVNQAPAAPPAPTQKALTAQESIDQLKTYLLAEAQKGTDPAMCADYAMETMPVELWNAIGNVPDPAGMLLQVFPEAAPHKAWFEKLVAEFFIEEDGKPDLEPAPHAAARPN